MAAAQPAPASGTLISTGAVARHCGLSRHTVLRAAKRGDLPVAQRTPGGNLRFRQVDVEYFARRLEVRSRLVPPHEFTTRTEAMLPQPTVHESWFRSAFEEAAIGISLVAPSGRLLAVNRALCTLLGYSTNELLALDFQALTHSDDLAASVIHTQRLLDGEAKAGLLEKRYLHRNGHAVWVQLSASLQRDDAGRPLYFINQVQDIAARKAAESALRASEERYRQVEQHAPIGLALVALDGHWLRVNPALCALVGYREDELLASTFQEITHPDDLDADLEYVRQVREGVIATYQLEKRYLRKDGRQLWVLLSVSLVRDEAGQPAYFISQIQDISARKAAEVALQASHLELERSNAELSQVAAAAAHDLRTPLTTIAGYAHLLTMRYADMLDARALGFVSFISTAAEQLQERIEALMAYARLDAEPALATSVDCAALVSRVVALLRAVVEERGAVVRYSGLQTVHGDARQLSLLFQNLIANALKFQRPGVRPEVIITAERQDSSWCFQVQDNGIGIAPAHRERIFNLFQRLHTTQEYPGTGIGLALCRKVVERHGGRIWVEPTCGQGTTFLFTLSATPSPR